MNGDQTRDFLRVPPFPGAKTRDIALRTRTPTRLPDETIDRLIGTVRELKVGGDYWAAQPSLQRSDYALIRVNDRHAREDILREIEADRHIVLWSDEPTETSEFAGRSIETVVGPCDPWHLLEGAALVVVHGDDELSLIAEILHIPVQRLDKKTSWNLRAAFRDAIEAFDYVDPFTGTAMSAERAIGLCAFWRHLVDSNRDIGAAVGFAFWKRATSAPLLWNGSSDVHFASRIEDIDRSRPVAIWKSRTSPALLAELERSTIPLVEVEDGFIRSAGLGADCVPPLSIVVDRLRAHFDPTGPSDLEQIIAHGPIPVDLVERAARLRKLIVQSGIGKYGADTVSLRSVATNRLTVLVPGQVEDDRAIRSGGGTVRTNLELLSRVRRRRPDAHIIYKPHPDVESGHRVGALDDDECLQFADEIARDQPISTLINAADEVHVISSLAGFEALLRGKRVTTYGAPFYSGWGLTEDDGPVPERRSAKRTLDELVAAVLLLYPRYLDPVTRLPCPAEILVQRIAEGSGDRPGVVVQLRRLQGRWKRRFARVGLG